MKSVLLTAGGSPQGLSFWASAGQCPRKAYYKRERLTLNELPVFGRPGPDGKPNAAFVGTLFHAYGQHGMEERLQFFTDEGPLEGYRQEEDEAWRLVKAYRKRYTDWETPTRSEVDIKLQLVDGFVITGRVDALVEIEGELSGCQHFFQRGLYIWDYKTAGRQNKDFVESYRLQLEGYMLMWNEQHPEEPVLGGVLDRITTTKEPECDRFFIPLPSERRQTHILETWFGFKRASEINNRNLSACVDQYRMCEFKARCDSED